MHHRSSLHFACEKLKTGTSEPDLMFWAHIHSDMTWFFSLLVLILLTDFLA